MAYIIIILSFILESVISNVVSMSSYFIPLFLLTSLVILYPYFKGNKLNYVITCGICGCIYDISFSDTIFVNTICFCIIGIISILCYSYFKYNIFSSNLLNVFNIAFYRLISYLILIIISYIKFNPLILFKGIYNSILANIIYGIVIYLLAKFLSKLFNIKLD